MFIVNVAHTDSKQMLILLSLYLNSSSLSEYRTVEAGE